MDKRLLIVVWLLVVLSFITTHTTGDFMVFWAYARQVSESELNGIPALIETWEIKGLLYRTILYYSYYVTSLVISDYSLECQFIYKLVTLVPFLAILFLSVKTLPERFLCGFNRYSLFFVVSILLLMTDYSTHFQPEMWGGLFLLLSLSLYLHDGAWYKVLSAIVCALTFYLKSPIPILGGSLVLSVALIKKQTIKESLKDLVPFVLSFVFFLALTLVFIYILYPQEIIDIYDSSFYQQTLIQIPLSFLGKMRVLLLFVFSRCLIGNMNIFYHIPVLLGLVATIWILFLYVKTKCFAQSLSLLLTWFFPLAYIVISNKYFVYHYYLLAFPSIVSLYLLWEMKRRNLKSVYITILSFVIMGYYLVALSSVAPKNLAYNNFYGEVWKRNKMDKNVYIGCKLDCDEIMYLDDGSGAFVFDNKSYLRYFYPLPLQRISHDNPFTKTDTYQQVKTKAMNFNGKYITLYEEWFFANDNMDIREKIIKEYELWKQIDVPHPSWGLLFPDNRSPILSVYKRKDNGTSL